MYSSRFSPFTRILFLFAFGRLFSAHRAKPFPRTRATFGRQAMMKIGRTIIGNHGMELYRRNKCEIKVHANNALSEIVFTNFHLTRHDVPIDSHSISFAAIFRYTKGKSSFVLIRAVFVLSFKRGRLIEFWAEPEFVIQIVHTVLPWKETRESNRCLHLLILSIELLEPTSAEAIWHIVDDMQIGFPVPVFSWYSFIGTKLLFNFFFRERAKPIEGTNAVKMMLEMLSQRVPAERFIEKLIECDSSEADRQKVKWNYRIWIGLPTI